MEYIQAKQMIDDLFNSITQKYKQDPTRNGSHKDKPSGLEYSYVSGFLSAILTDLSLNAKDNEDIHRIVWMYIRQLKKSESESEFPESES